MKLIISRTDAIGDVCLTLPTIGWLKSIRPDWQISMLVSDYSAPLAKACRWIDEVVVIDHDLETGALARLLRLQKADHIIHVFPHRKLAKAAHIANIPKRAGVWGRLYHWLHCNAWVFMSRARSPHHEAYLNLDLVARSLGLACPTSTELQANMVAWSGLKPDPCPSPFDFDYVILHPYSRGNGREWPTEHFASLAHQIADHGWVPVICGTTADQASFKPFQHLFPARSVFHFGQDNLSQYMARIQSSAALVASGTGPLHIASALGKWTFGLFPPRKNINTARWGGFGPQSINFEIPGPCQNNCSNQDCACMLAIQPDRVWAQLKTHLPLQTKGV